MVVDMEIAAVLERVGRIGAVRADAAAGRVDRESALVEVRRVRAWLDASEADLVRGLVAEVSFPEQSIAASSKGSLGQASTVVDRAATLASLPSMAAALDGGAITAGHVDAVTRAGRDLDVAQRNELSRRVDRLVDVAEHASQAEFARRVRDEARRVQADDGMDRLEQQRRAVRVSTWVDADGMWNLRGRFDPVTGVRLDAKLRATLEATFAEQTPLFCPDDPVEKQRFLAGHALVALIDGAGTGSRSGRAEFVVVIDADAPTAGMSGPVVEWPIPVEIPARVLAELVGDGDVHAVVVRNGVVLYAPGELNLGRATRLANRAQRRALRGLYATCAIPGCHTHYDRCKLHHLVWWRHGGRTDLDNLIPVCVRCHTAIHHDGWVVELGPDRELTLRLPDGTRPIDRPTRPPSRLTTRRYPALGSSRHDPHPHHRQQQRLRHARRAQPRPSGPRGGRHDAQSRQG